MREDKCQLKCLRQTAGYPFRICLLSLTISQYAGVPEGKVSILGGHSIGHSKKKVYMNVSHSERFPIFGAQYFEFGTQYFPSLLL
jgi:hypothetical protein